MKENPALKSWLYDRITTIFLQPVQYLAATATPPASIDADTMRIIKERIFGLGNSSDLSVMQPFSPTDQHADNRWRTESVCLTYSLYLMGQLQYEWLSGGGAVRQLLRSRECGVSQWSDIMHELGNESFVWPSPLIVGNAGQAAAALAVQGHTGVNRPAAQMQLPAPPTGASVLPGPGAWRDQGAAEEEEVRQLTMPMADGDDFPPSYSWGTSGWLKNHGASGAKLKALSRFDLPPGGTVGMSGIEYRAAKQKESEAGPGSGGSGGLNGGAVKVKKRRRRSRQKKKKTKHLKRRGKRQRGKTRRAKNIRHSTRRNKKY